MPAQGGAESKAPPCPGDISAEILQTIHSMSYSSVQGLGFRVQGLGLLFLRSRVQGLVFRVQGLESMIWGWSCARVQGSKAQEQSD